MSFAVKYSKKFQRMGVTATYRIDILSEAGGPVITPHKMGADPFQLKTLGSERDEDKIVIGSEITFEFVLLKRAGEANYNPLFESEYRDHIVKFYNDDTSTLLWQGYLQPENMYKSMFESNLHIYLSATDALKDLADYEFLDSGDIITGYLTGLEIIKLCLTNLDVSAQFQYNFVIKLGTKHTGQGANDNALKDVSHDCRRFSKVENGKTEVDNCLTVIEKVLKPYSCILQQWEGKYYIKNRHEGNTNNYTYNWALAFQSKAAANDAVNIDTYKFQREADISFLSPVKEIGLKLLNRNPGDELVADINDFSGAGPWDFTGFPGGDVIDEDPNLHIILDDGNELNDRDITLSADFSLNKVTDNDYIKLRVKFRATNIQHSNIDSPKLVITVTKPGGDSSTWEEFIITNWRMYESPNNEVFLVTEDGDYNITITFEQSTAAVAPYTENVYLTDFSLTKIVAIDETTFTDITFDTFYRAISNVGKNVKDTIDMYFGDSPGIGDVAGLIYAAAQTYEWDRNGVNDNKPLLYLWALNYLTNRKAYSKYLILSVKDSGDSITPLNFVEYDSDNYDIVSYEKSFRTSWATLHLKERLTGDVTLDFQEIPMTSIDGEKTTTTTLVTEGSGSSLWADITGKPAWVTGATTVGGNLVDLVNPGAISFIRINADNSVSALSDVNFKTALALQNVTNESKATMFTDPTFTGVTTITRTAGSPSIKAGNTGGGNGDVVIDALGTGQVSLNQYVSNDVYLAIGGGKVSVGIAAPIKIFTVSESDDSIGFNVARAAVARINNTSTTIGSFSGIAFGRNNTEAQTTAMIGEILVNTDTSWSSDLVLGVKAANDAVNVTEYIRLKVGGKTGFGTSLPNAKIESLSTTEQLRLSYDATHYLSFTTDANGDATISASGGNIGLFGPTVGLANFVLTGTSYFSSTTYHDGTVQEYDFTAGWSGSNWRVTTGGGAEFESIFCRGALTVHELIINRLHYQNGGLNIGPGAGKIKEIHDATLGAEILEFQDPNGGSIVPFTVGSVVMMQLVDINRTTVVRKIVREVDSIAAMEVTFKATAGWVPAIDDVGTFSPGDEVCAIAHTATAALQNNIYLTSIDANNPYIRISTEVDSYSDWNSWARTKVLIGNLASIASQTYGSLVMPASPGYGFFSDNCYLSGKIVSVSGIIGGWTLGATTITGGDATLDSTGVLTLGTGDDVAVMSAVDGTYRLWIGDATAADAEFSVTKVGALKAVGCVELGTSTQNYGGALDWNCAIKGADIWENDYDGNGSAIMINRIGHGGTTDHFRDFAVYDGKGVKSFQIGHAASVVTCSLGNDTDPEVATMWVYGSIVLVPTADPPATVEEGSIYADTDHHLYYYNGSTWKQLDN